MDEDNFAYTVNIENKNDNLIKLLQKETEKYRTYASSSFLEVVSLPYIAHKYIEVVPEPYTNYFYVLMAAEVVAAGILLRSGYLWWKNSREVRKLEQLVE